MNTIITIVLLVFAVAWLISLANRNREWSFALWFPLTGTSVFATLAWLATIPSLGNSGGGPEGGFAALGAAMAFLYLLPASIILVLSIVFRPRIFEPRVVVPTVVAVVLLVVGIFVWSRHAERTPVHLVVVDSQEHPIAGAECSYTTRPRRNGFSPPTLQGTQKTDSDGRVTLWTQTTHEITITLRMDGFETASMRIDRDFGRGYQKSVLSWSTQSPTERWRQSYSERFDVTIGKELPAKVYLPRPNETDLPYSRF